MSTMTREGQRMKFIAILILAAGIVVAGDGLMLPDHTPGVANPEVTQQNIHQTICMAGLTKTIPPASFTNKLKIQQMQELGCRASPRITRKITSGHSSWAAPHATLDNLDPPTGCINRMAHHPALVIPPSAALLNLS
jgi:hypothetical protein